MSEFGQPLCGYLPMVTRDTDYNTACCGIDFIKEITTALQTSVDSKQRELIEAIKLAVAGIDAKVTLHIQHSITGIADATARFDSQIQSLINTKLASIGQTVASFFPENPTAEKVQVNPDVNLPSINPANEEQKQTVVDCPVQSVDYFPLIVGFLPADNPRWKGYWKACRSKNGCVWRIVPEISTCPPEAPYEHTDIPRSTSFNSTLASVQAQIENWSLGGISYKSRPEGFTPKCADVKYRDPDFPVEQPGGIFGLALLNWFRDTACTELASKLAGIANIAGESINRALGLTDADGKNSTPKWLADLIQGIPILPNWLSSGIAGLIRAVVGVIDNISSGLGGDSPCNSKRMSAQYAVLLINGILDKYTGFKIPKVEQNVTYQIDYNCPERLPTSNDADSMFLGNEIDWEKWKCLVSANNDIWQQRIGIVNASRQKPSANEYLRFWARGKIDDKELDKRLRGLGWIFDKDTEVIKELSWEYPSPSDLITFMLRDVFDKTVIDQFGYADEFKSKFSGKAKELFTAAGVKEEIALLQWMAHWKNPSNTQLFDMYHRLRGGNRKSGIKRWFDKDGNKLPNPVELTHEDIKVTESDVARAIGINDVLPFWRDRLLAISRPPLTRVDVRRAYDIDSIGEDDVYESYRDLGYDEEKARTLTKFATELKKRGDVRRKGFMLPSRISNLYKRGGLNRAEAKQLLVESGLREDDATANLKQADTEVKAMSRIECVKALEKRFMVGDIEGHTLVTLLMQNGVEQEHALAIRKRLECKLSLKTKEVTAGILCGWRERLLISKEDHFIRLVRIGYTEEDAGRIVEHCEMSASDKKAQKTAKGSQYLQDPDYVPPDNRPTGELPKGKEKKGKRKG